VCVCVCSLLCCECHRLYDIDINTIIVDWKGFRRKRSFPTYWSTLPTHS